MKYTKEKFRKNVAYTQSHYLSRDDDFHGSVHALVLGNSHTPSFLQNTPTEIVANIGSTVRFNCMVRNVKNYTVSIQLNSQPEKCFLMHD